MSQQQFQPQIYPYNNVPLHPDASSQSSSSSSSSHSNGSFGTVFLVLAAILVVSVLACIANRLCSRRSNSDHHDHHAPKNTMKIHGHGPRGDGKLPREWEGKVQMSHEGGDLELGKRINGSAKVGDEPSTSSFMAHDNNGGGKGGGARFAVHHVQFKPAIRSSSFERI